MGTYTNAGVIGEDNADFGWLRRYPSLHDLPCRDITLTGEHFPSDNPLTPEPNDRAETGAFAPFGTKTVPGRVIRGQVPCSGAVLRVPLHGGAPELVAWGFRNPFGLAFAPDGRLFVTDNSYDVRGSRPVFGTGDLLWAVTPGMWHGWPDFHGGHPLNEGRYQPLGRPCPIVIGHAPEYTATTSCHLRGCTPRRTALISRATRPSASSDRLSSPNSGTRPRSRGKP